MQLRRRPTATSRRPDPYELALQAVQRERQARARNAAAREVEQNGEEIKAQCETLAGFIRYFWPILEPGTPYVHNWHIDAICLHLEAIVEGRAQNLAVNIPPGHMKSLLISVFFPAWWWTKDATKRFLSGSFEEENALRDNEKMRALVQSPEYQALWGETTRLIKAGVKSFVNVSRGGRQAAAYGSMTGKRGDIVLIDDPHSVNGAESDKERKKAVRLFTESIQNRTNDAATSAIIVIMQRVHAGDICGAIDDLGLDYIRLVLPHEFEEKRRCKTRLGWSDPRTYEGEILFPGKFPREATEKLKKVGSYAWSGQYQQRPVPREGGLFKREWFEGKIIRQAPPGMVWWRHWDLAATELQPGATTGARTAGVKMGRAPDGTIIVGHCIVAAKEGGAVKKLIRATAEVDGIAVNISIPQDPGAGGKVVRQDYIAALSGFNARRMIESGDKVERATPFSAECENGNVYLLEGSWNQEYLDELCLFPGGNRKDIPDASSGAYARLIPVGTGRKKGLVAPEIITGDDDDGYDD
jgi:predicted phage terminase large subunit-like protein